MKRQSQCNRVMQYMRDFGSISTREAFDDLGLPGFPAAFMT